MDIILGATGHVGSVVAKQLLSIGEEVTVVTHDPGKKSDWIKTGATVAVLDVHETKALHQLFDHGQRLFFLNPPADPATDAVKEEKLTVYSILNALKNSTIKKVVAESSYGSQLGDGIGDLGVLNEMEEGLKDLGIPTSVIRAAFYMSNWDSFFEAAKETGEITTFYPADLKLPMIAPEDLGKFAAKLLSEPVESTGIYYVEGPERYSVSDVAAAFSKILNRPVKVVVLGDGEWLPWLMQKGYSQSSAESMVRMTEIVLRENYDRAKAPILCPTTLEAYFSKFMGQVH